MKIEKISDNKLKFMFSISELDREKVNYHSFMSGSSIFDNIVNNLLYIAKDELDFDTKNCNIEIQTFEISKGNFVITITKCEQSLRKLQGKRKQGKLSNKPCIFEFYKFEDYCEFALLLKANFSSIYDIFICKSQLYNLNSKYILIIDGSAFLENEIEKFNTLITEFATFKSNSNILISKIKECNL